MSPINAYGSSKELSSRGEAVGRISQGFYTGLGNSLCTGEKKNHAEDAEE